jgi:hypothetical protein
MEKIEKLEKLLQSYSYAELSAIDREGIQDLVSSEEEYEALRETNKQLALNAEHKLDFSPSPAIFKKIKISNRAMRKPVWSGAWLQSPIPSYATLLIAIFVGSLAWWGGSQWNSKLIFAEKIKLKIDTVYLASKPDTVIREKIIYVKVKVSADQVIQASLKSNQQEAVVTRGVSMKEKEELGKLLVSGSY